MIWLCRYLNTPREGTSLLVSASVIWTVAMIKRSVLFDGDSTCIIMDIDPCQEAPALTSVDSFLNTVRQDGDLKACTNPTLRS